MHLGKMANDGQPQTRSVGPGGEIGCEQRIDRFVGDARSAIGHGDATGPILSQLPQNLNGRPRGSSVNRILHEVEQRLAKQFAVGLDHGSRRERLVIERQLMVDEIGFQEDREFRGSSRTGTGSRVGCCGRAKARNWLIRAVTRSHSSTIFSTCSCC